MVLDIVGVEFVRQLQPIVIRRHFKVCSLGNKELDSKVGNFFFFFLVNWISKVRSIHYS